MPVFSLPSKYGIGCFSKEAYKFVDKLKKAGQSYWQILPLGPTGQQLQSGVSHPRTPAPLIAGSCRINFRVTGRDMPGLLSLLQRSKRPDHIRERT